MVNLFSVLNKTDIVFNEYVKIPEMSDWKGCNNTTLAVFGLIDR